MSASLSPNSGGGPFNPPAADPPTTMVPPKRAGVFAVIHVDAREAGLRIARFLSDGSFHQVRQERDSFNGGGVQTPQPRQIATRLAHILSHYQRIAELHGASLRAVATQSFRVVPNHAQMLQRLPRVTRVPLDLLSEREAAQFLCLGALRGRPEGHRAVVVDVGENAASVILAKAQEPLALWRLGVGTNQVLESAGPAGWDQPDGVRMRSWRRQIQQVLSLGHLEAIRGVVSEATLVCRRGVNPSAVDHLAAVTALNEIAAYLEIQNIHSTESGLPEGILIALSRTLPVSSAAESRSPSVRGPQRNF